jgi:hypothetical protein
MQRDKEDRVAPILAKDEWPLEKIRTLSNARLTEGITATASRG